MLFIKWWVLGKGKYLLVFDIFKIRNIVCFCIYVERVIGRFKIFGMLLNIILLNVKLLVNYMIDGFL